MSTRQPASFNATFSRIAASRAPCLQLRGATREKALFTMSPTRWAMPPAALKGWLDRVLRQGVAYEFTAQGVNGLLKGRTAVVFTTSNTPRDDELRLYGDPLEDLWKACIFNFCGVEDFYRRNFESIVMSTPEERAEWLNEVRKIIAGRFPKSRYA